MNITPEELELEKRYLKKTLDVIKSLINKDDVIIQDKISSINEMKRYIWENNAMLDDIEVATSMYNVNTDVETTNESIKKLQKLKRSLTNPYFGRVDFNSDDFSDSIYIGVNGIMKNMDFYVYDWRTPIASLFYNYGVGPASYEAVIGTIKGKVELKRQYKINGETIERCFNSDLNIDDEYLQEILSNSSSDKMTNIVNTIQKEQNEIIRNIVDKYLIVQGVAGSGKTSVALHRIAYLLYKEKELTSNNVLIFSPNEVFSEYISNVLPDLGEDNVLQTTFSDFAKSYIKDYQTIESFTSFIERYYSNESIDGEQFKSTKYKLSNDFKQLLDKFILKINITTTFNGGLRIGDKEITKESLNDLLNRYGRQPLFSRLDSIAEYICESNSISYKKHGSIVKEKIKKLLNNKLSVKSIYSDILSSNEFKENAGLIQVDDFSEERTLKYEDLLPLMYLNFELNGYPRGNMIKHIIIDEAQDYSLLQIEILSKIFNRASFTILGDVNQTINPYYKYYNLNEINSIFNQKGRYIELLKTYRSSEEIIDYTNQILGINNVCSVRKSNSLPIILRDVEQNNAPQQLIKDIEIMKDNGMKRVAIITKNNSETRRLYEALSKQLKDIGLVDESGKSTNANTVILPSYISKGLEFDGVIAYTDKEQQYQDKDKYLFYVVCTRAQHSLTIYNQKRLVLERK